MKHLFYLLLISFISFSLWFSCGSEDLPEPPPDEEEPIIIDPPIDPFDPDTVEVIVLDPVKIIYNAQTATITNPFEGKGVTVTQQNAHIVVRSTTTDTVSYIITGTTPNGSLKIYSETQFVLIINGVDIINANDPAINIQTKRKATVILADGSSSRLVGGMGYISEESDEKAKAAFFSRGQLVFTDAGSLTVISRYRHAICSDDYISIDGGTITVPISANDGFHANDYIEINAGKIDIYSMGDGMDSEGYILIKGGDINITTIGDKSHGIKSTTETTVQTSGDIIIKVEGDASKAFKCGGNMLISQGNLQLMASGDACYDAEEADMSSASGIKCNGNLTISGGTIVISSTGLGGKGINVTGTLTINAGEIEAIATGGVYKISNDNTKARAIKSDGTLTIKGGNIYAVSKTDDAIATKGNLTITGGTVISVASELSKKGFNCSKTFGISGGTIVGASGASSAPTASACTQNVVNFTGNITQNQYYNISSSSGKNILTYQLPCTLSRAFVLFSNPDLTRGQSYTISSGGEVAGGTAFHGLFNDAVYQGGTIRANFTISSILTNLN